MLYNRRSLIKFSALVLSSVLAPFQGRFFKTKNGGVVMKVVTTFPHAISEERWTEIKAGLSGPNFSGLKMEMISNNEIIREHTQFYGTHAVWEVEFRDLIASEKWIHNVNSQELVNKDYYRSLGIDIESYVS